MPDAFLPRPPKPQPPQDYECCGGGCADCDLRTYLRALAEWQSQATGEAPAGGEPSPA